MSSDSRKKHPAIQMVAGAIAGFVESSVCHPLDTIKTRMQLRRQSANIDLVRARSSLHEPDVVRALSSLSEPRIFLSKEAASSRARRAIEEAHHLSLSRVHEPASLTQTFSSTLVNEPPTAIVCSKKSNHNPLVAAPLGPIGTARRIILREGVLSLYKGIGQLSNYSFFCRKQFVSSRSPIMHTTGLTAVYFGIIPKMAIRFVSFEQYRETLQQFASHRSTSPNQHSGAINFFAGLFSGLTEAIVIVTPAEVCKVRLQGQYNSLVDPAQMARRKYTNVFQTAFVIVREEGIGALYKGVAPTMLRQGINQAVNFSVYNWFKKKVLERQNPGSDGVNELKHWQSLVLGGVSGGFGPLINNPLGACLEQTNHKYCYSLFSHFIILFDVKDVVKTRTQKQVIIPGKEPKYKGIIQSCKVIVNEEGMASLWRGLTPRLLRIMPGQAITFVSNIDLN